ncbi:FAD-binding oxidoreductase [Pseudonocardia nematodicida]|uniref:FAD-binding oxidoreductase n=1 Tax=Pseudonocardia nematodicida TaxID=1206997 RepID=A0ABV1KIE2_9PSEU
MKHQFVIIGGGVYGCAAAWNLADAGHDVVLLEARGLASGASGGFGRRGVRANRRDLRELPAMRAAYRLWPELDDRLGVPTGYRRTGGLYLIEQDTTGTRGGLLAAAAHAGVQSALGIPTEAVGRDRVFELEPAVSPDVRGALYCPLDGTADHAATTRAFAEAAEKRGATLREDQEVVAVERDGDRAVAVRTATGDRFEVGTALLVLANTGAAGLVRDAAGVELPVWPVLPQALRIAPDDGPPMTHLVGHDHRPVSLKPLTDGSVMVSGGWRGRRNPETGQGEPTEEGVRGNLRAAAEVFPALAGAEPLEAVANAPESCSADEIPIVDLVPGLANAWVGTGWTAHGFALAPAVAESLTSWVTTGTRPDDLAPFALSRFGPLPRND